MFFFCTCGASERCILVTSCRRLKGVSSSTTLPASILLKSRMSLTSTRRPSAVNFSICISSTCSGRGLSSSSEWLIPITALRGVRISWLIIERNCDLASAASSALIFSCSNCWARASFSAISRSSFSLSSCNDALYSTTVSCFIPAIRAKSPRKTGAVSMMSRRGCVV